VIECPKCGFLQPKDRYCAKCGLDIENFVPAEVPFAKKILNNTLLHSFLLILAISATTLILVQKQKNTTLETDNETTMALDPAKKSGARPEPTSAADITTAQNQMQKMSAQETAAPTAATQFPDPVSADSRQIENTGAVANAKPNRYQILFFEISQSSLKRISEEGLSLYDGGGVRAYSLPKVTNLAALKTWNGVRSLPGQSEGDIDTSFTVDLDFVKPLASELDEVGMELVMAQTDIKNTGTTVAFSNSLRFRQTDVSAISQSQLEASMNIPHNTVVLVLGLLPHSPMAADDLQVLQETPMSIYNSKNFRLGNSDLGVGLILSTPTEKPTPAAK
jgi:hypothetical protein